MTATGVKAGKAKSKSTKVDLAAWLQTSVTSSGKVGGMSWADELDVTESGGSAADLPALPEVAEANPSMAGNQSFSSHRPGSPRSSSAYPGNGGRNDRGGGQYETNALPAGPPFTAQLHNIPFVAPEEEIANFFSKLNVQDIRILRWDDTQKPKSALVDFADRDSLAQGIAMEGSYLRGRAVRIFAAESNRGGRNRSSFSGGGASSEVHYKSRVGGFGGDRHRDNNPGGGFGGASRFEGASGGQWRSNAHTETSTPAAAAAPSATYNQPSSNEINSSAAIPNNQEPSTQSTQPSAVPPPTSTPSAPKANPFGNAKAVDTAAKLAEMDARDALRKAEAAKADSAARQAAAAAAAAAAPSVPSQNGVLSQGTAVSASTQGPSSNRLAAPVAHQSSGTAPEQKQTTSDASSGKALAAVRADADASVPTSEAPPPPKMAWQKPSLPPPINLADITPEDAAADVFISSEPALDAPAGNGTPSEAAPLAGQQQPPQQQQQQSGMRQQQQGRGGPSGDFGGRGRGRRGGGEGRGRGYRGGRGGRGEGPPSDWAPQGAYGGRGGRGPGRGGGRYNEGNGPAGRINNDSRAGPRDNPDAAPTDDSEWSEQNTRRRQTAGPRVDRQRNEQRPSQQSGRTTVQQNGRTTAPTAEATKAAPPAKSQNLFDFLGED